MKARTMVVATAITLTATLGACSSGKNSAGGAGSSAAGGGSVKLGLIMKFPVDFYLSMKSAAQKWQASTSGVTVSIGIGQSATDDQGEINLIQSMVTQGVKGIAITPTSPAVIPALNATVAKGVKVVLID